MTTIEIPLTKGKVAIIDEADREVVAAFTWHTRQNRKVCYAESGARRSGSTRYMMHRLILGVCDREDLIVDHRDGNGLNNTRGNLRLATASQNAANSRIAGNPYRGVTFRRDAIARKWLARILVDGQRRSLGTYATAEEAATAYDAAAKQLFGEFATLNFTNIG
jgi:hypothetical protein